MTTSRRHSLRHRVFRTLVAMVALVAAGCTTSGRTAAPNQEPITDIFHRTMVFTAPLPKHAVFMHVAASPDGQLIAAGGTGGGSVTVWHAHSGAVKWQLHDIAWDPVVAFSRDSRYLITASIERTVRPIRAFATLYDVETAALVADLIWPDDSPDKRRQARLIAVDPKGEQIAVESGSCNEIFVYETSRWSLAHRWHIPGSGWDVGCITAIAYSPDGSIIAVGTHLGMVVALDRAGVVIRDIKAHSATINSIAFTPAGWLLTASISQQKSIIQKNTEAKVVKYWNEQFSLNTSMTYPVTRDVRDIAVDAGGNYAIASGNLTEIYSVGQSLDLIQHLPIQGYTPSVRAGENCFVIAAGEGIENWCRGERK